MTGAEQVEATAARGGFAFGRDRAEAVAAELEALRGELEPIAALPAPATEEPATTFAPA